MLFDYVENYKRFFVVMSQQYDFNYAEAETERLLPKKVSSTIKTQLWLYMHWDLISTELKFSTFSCSSFTRAVFPYATWSEGLVLSHVIIVYLAFV